MVFVPPTVTPQTCRPCTLWITVFRTRYTFQPGGIGSPQIRDQVCRAISVIFLNLSRRFGFGITLGLAEGAQVFAPDRTQQVKAKPAAAELCRQSSPSSGLAMKKGFVRSAVIASP